MLTLGSLFDGSGTCPLAAQMCGVTPLWASEIEEFPVAVTTSRFPNMKHLGDITKLRGSEIEPVDIITFGSPCQNLSMAGNRKGLKGEESSLFLEAVRIIQEMRDATNGKYPQLVMWENVFGAFSSNGGDDFRTVVESLCQICDPRVSISRPKKWKRAGCVMGRDYSLAWRTLDAQYWGVAQRRRRIFLVLDLGGCCAGEILFEREGVRRHYPKIEQEQQTVARSVGDSIEKRDRSYAVENHPHDNRVSLERSDVVQTLNARMGTGGGNVPLLIQSVSPNSPMIATTLKASGGNYGGGSENILMFPANTFVQSRFDEYKCSEQAATLGVCIGALGGGSETLIAENTALNDDMILYLIRKLTPTECASLQGFPKDWCALVPHKDTPEYKMWGNGMALPCVLYVMEGMSKILQRRFLHKLFDGGGSVVG